MTVAQETRHEGGSGHLLCIGLGYTARALAGLLSSQGYAVTGTSRTVEGMERIEAGGWRAVLFADGVTPSLAAAARSATHVLVSAAPDEAGDPVLRALGTVLVEASDLRWIGYLSTVGVYGDRGGAWIDETTLPQAGNARSRRRLEAEMAWEDFAARTRRRVEIFRLPGIYGPGRSAIDTVRAGTARRIIKPGQVFNRMHVEDIALALAAALAGPPRHPLYNLCDDEPAPPEDVVAYAADLLGLPQPPAVLFAEAELSPMARSFYAESKRVSNRRMKDALGVRLRYPSYREGLAAIARGKGGA